MIRLKPVLSVKELPPSYSHMREFLPGLQDYVAKQPRHDEENVIYYLQHGVVCEISLDRGMDYDVLQPGKRIEKFSGDQLIQPNVLLTDGVWVWPGALIYYVREYHVILDPDFLQHAEAKNWNINPAEIDIKNLNTEKFYTVEQMHDSFGKMRQ